LNLAFQLNKEIITNTVVRSEKSKAVKRVNKLNKALQNLQNKNSALIDEAKKRKKDSKINGQSCQ